MSFSDDCKWLRQNASDITIDHRNSKGEKIAFFQENCKAHTKTLFFNAAMMESPKTNGMTCIQRAKPEYRADFAEIEKMYPGVPQREFVLPLAL